MVDAKMKMFRIIANEKIIISKNQNQIRNTFQHSLTHTHQKTGLGQKSKTSNKIQPTKVV